MSDLTSAVAGDDSQPSPRATRSLRSSTKHSSCEFDSTALPTSTEFTKFLRVIVLVSAACSEMPRSYLVYARNIIKIVVLVAEAINAVLPLVLTAARQVTCGVIQYAIKLIVNLFIVFVRQFCTFSFLRLSHHTVMTHCCVVWLAMKSQTSSVSRCTSVPRTTVSRAMTGSLAWLFSSCVTSLTAVDVLCGASSDAGYIWTTLAGQC